MKIFLSTLFAASFLFAKAQPHETYKTAATSNQCQSTLLLYTDATYAYEVGCETQPHLSFGTWTKKKDAVLLSPADPKTFAVIKSVSATRSTGDTIWLTILDKDGQNMSAKISTGLEVSGRGSYLFTSDASGTKKCVYKRSGGKIVFRTLNKLFGQHLELPTDTANNFVVSLNISADWINNSHADWNNTGPVLLLKKGDVFLTVSRNNERQVFQKQKE